MMITKSELQPRADLYSLLSRLYRVEVDASLLDKLKGLTFPQAANETLAQGYAMLRSYLDSCGEEALDVYGEFLRSLGEPLLPHGTALWIIRIVLLVALVGHIYGAIALHSRSKASRGSFRRSNLMGGLDSFATKSMLVTGIVLLLFLIFHLLDLTMGVAPAAPDAFVHGAVKANMIATFSRWPVTIFYVLAMCCLFLHLTHGIKLAASDLGITGYKWRQTFLVLAYLIPAIVCIGNIVMPLSVAFGFVS